MRRGPFFRVTSLLLAALLAASCATTRVPPISAEGAAFKPLNDEKSLWDGARAEEKKLLEKAPLYDDPLLEEYLQKIVNRLNTPGMVANTEIAYRVRVLEDPTLNAFAYPHGSLYVHTGLLARMENEDQLATVLGHEMTHVENRHMLRYQRSAQNRSLAIGVAAIAAAVVVAGEVGAQEERGNYRTARQVEVLAGLLLGLGLQLTLIATVNGYGRSLEREADEGGMQKMVAAGYEPREAKKVYELLLDDHGDSSKAEAFFFGSHPRLAERIENAKEWVGAHPGKGGENGERDQTEFDRRMRSVVRDDARLNVRLGRLNLAQSQLDRIRGVLRDDPEVHFLTAKLALARAEKTNDEAKISTLRGEALDALLEAIRLDGSRPEYHRELGLLAYRTGDGATACSAFREYVGLAGDAGDVGPIRDYLRELEQDGKCP